MQVARKLAPCDRALILVNLYLNCTSLLYKVNTFTNIDCWRNIPVILQPFIVKKTAYFWAFRIDFSSQSMFEEVKSNMADEDEINQNKICFEEIHFFPIVSQTNVYGLTTFSESNKGCGKVLLACLNKGSILSVSSPQSAGPSSLSSVNVPFKNIQGSQRTSAFNFSIRYIVY